jgi:hypothetical protein
MTREGLPTLRIRTLDADGNVTGEVVRRSGVRMLDDVKHYVEHSRPSPRKQKQLAN